MDTDFIKISPPLLCRYFHPQTKIELETEVSEISETKLILARGTFTHEDEIHLKILGLDKKWVEIKARVQAKNQRFFLETLPESLKAQAMILGHIRKDQHIEICKSQDVEASDHDAGFSKYFLVPNALADLDANDVDCKQPFLGRVFSLPMLITGMTGGLEKGALINQNLAYAASKFNIPMGIGSQRIALENPDLEAIFQVKNRYPDLFLIGNIGAAQLLTNDGLKKCERAILMIDADALAIHVNIIQELIQVEGDRCFKGILKAIEHLCRKTKRPIIVKEVGCGIHPRELKKLIDAGVSAVDVGGRGGTSWARIEGLRSSSPRVQRLGETFRDWGLSTADCLTLIEDEDRKIPIIATGGVRDGLMVAKALALKATMVGVGMPLFRAACISEEAVIEELHTFSLELKIAMLASGCANITQLPKVLTKK